MKQRMRQRIMKTDETDWNTKEAKEAKGKWEAVNE